MSDQTSRRLFRFKVARPVFEIAVIDVQATGHNEARAAAIEAAANLLDAAWRGSFTGDLSDYDIQDVLDSAEMMALLEEGVIDQNDPMEMNAEPDPDIRYALLRADLFGGEGDFIPPSWLYGESKLMADDLTRDWVCALEHWRAEDLAQFPDDTEARERPGAACQRAVAPLQSRQEGTVVSLDLYKARRAARQIARQYLVEITVQEDGATSIDFNVELSPENIDDITDDVQLVADRLRDDRANLLHTT